MTQLKQMIHLRELYTAMKVLVMLGIWLPYPLQLQLVDYFGLFFTTHGTFER